METSLHRELKERHGAGGGGRTEVTLRGYRIDAVTGDGLLVEVQSGALAPLRPKLRQLLPSQRILVVKPVVVAKRVVRRASEGGPDQSARFSPKRGSLADLFEDLIGLAGTFPHPNLEIEAVAVEIDEVRVARRRWPGFAVRDRCLRRVVESRWLRGAEDLWDLLPESARPEGPFTTADLARRLDRPLAFAQRVAYCLRHAGAATAVGKSGNHWIYERSGSAAAASTGFRG